MISSTWSGSPEISASCRASVDLPPPALPKTATFFIEDFRNRVAHHECAYASTRSASRLIPNRDAREAPRSGSDRRLDDLVRLVHRLAALDLVDVLHAFDHL